MSRASVHRLFGTPSNVINEADLILDFDPATELASLENEDEAFEFAQDWPEMKWGES